MNQLWGRNAGLEMPRWKLLGDTRFTLAKVEFLRKTEIGQVQDVFLSLLSSLSPVPTYLVCIYGGDGPIRAPVGPFWGHDGF